MKEFEKWLKSTDFSEVLCYECGGICKEDLEPVWKAALEWALKNEGIMYADPEDYYNDDGWLVVTSGQIRKELEQ